jgi:hypothetical protein
VKQIGEPKTTTARNGLGHDATSTRTNYVIEKSDVGMTRENYRGKGHSQYTFEGSDVGKEIAVYTDGTGWTCWVF